MNLILAFSIVLATLMLSAAVKNKMINRHLISELNDIKIKLEESEKKNMDMRDEISRIKKTGGVGESTVLFIAGEIVRMENNIYHMNNVPGSKQLMKALERMKGALQAEDYTIVPLLGSAYVEGMNAKAVFVPDKSLEDGVSVIRSVQKPQVNYQGRMIQAASIIVGQNIQ